MVFENRERLSDVVKLSAHVTRVLGQNPGMVTLQGTNSYILQPPSSAMAPMILIDTSSPHTSSQYVDCLFTHLHHLGLEGGVREVHFESAYAADALKHVPEEKVAEVKAIVHGDRMENPRHLEHELVEYGPGATWTSPAKSGRKMPTIEHIILTHRHLDHVGALPALLKTMQKMGMPKPKLWKLPSPDEVTLANNPRDRLTTDAALLASLPNGMYTPFSPFQPFHPIMPGLMISIIDPTYRHLLKNDKEGKPKWNDVPEIARVSVRCIKTPGPTADSISLIMCEGEKGAFTGDLVLGEKDATPIFTNNTSYVLSLKTLLALKPNAIYPGHGPHVPSAEKSAAHLQTYITQLQDLEKKILLLLEEVAVEGVLATKLREYQEMIKAKKFAEEKYQAEFHSGKPYKPKKKDVKKDGKDEEKEEKEEEEFDPIKPFEKELGITVNLICRFIYQTNDEKMLFSAGHSVFAQLQKLEKEGKVKSVKVKMPKIINDEVGEVEEQDGWQATKAE